MKKLVNAQSVRGSRKIMSEGECEDWGGRGGGESFHPLWEIAGSPRELCQK